MRIQELDGCQVKDGKILVTKGGARLRLNYDGLASSETYLIVENLNYQALSPRELLSEDKWEKMSQYEKNKTLYETRNWRYWKQSRDVFFSDREDGDKGYLPCLRTNTMPTAGRKIFSAIWGMPRMPEKR